MTAKNNNYPIDFVVLWVDGSDKTWLEKKKKYKTGLNVKEELQRYRDWGIFKYWFRAVEKYAPWVNHVYLVTDGQKPGWLNEECRKITVVDHAEIIDKDKLPIFNSQAIEANIYKIPNLSEHFVYFNDDMFIGKRIKPEEFFKNGMPVEAAIINASTGMGSDESYARALFNDAIVINRHFNKKDVFKKNPFKWLNIRNGANNIRTIMQLPYPYFTGFKPIHMPAPLLKSTFRKVWKEERSVLENTSLHKFRHNDDVNQYLFSWWQICEGSFVPKKINSTKYIEITDSTIDECKRIIGSKKYSEFCLNDKYDGENFDYCKNEIMKSFEYKLKDKSVYEK